MGLGNKEIMARNIKRLMQENGVNSTDVCNALGFKAPTFSDWVNGKTYPRIDKIEMMANYFGVMKSDLIEDQSINLQPVVEHISQSMDAIRKAQQIAATLAGSETFDTAVLTHPNVAQLLDIAQDATQAELLDAVSYLEYQKSKRSIPHTNVD